MKVSILIPVYNVAPFVGACLDSVLRQTYSDLQVVLVDDRGSDNSWDVVSGWIERLSARFEVKTIIHEKNFGLAATRNSALEVASGDYIFFLDSDDILADDAIERLMQSALNDGDADIVRGGVAIVGERVGREFPVTLQEVLCGNESIMSRCFARKFSSVAWNMLIKRRFFDEGLRFADLSAAEDELFSFSLFLRCNKMSNISFHTYYYLQREGSIMKFFRRHNLESSIEVERLKLLDMQNFVISESLYGRAYDYFVAMFYLITFQLMSGVEGVARSERRRYWRSIVGLLELAEPYRRDVSVKSSIIACLLRAPYPVASSLIWLHTRVSKK